MDIWENSNVIYVVNTLIDANFSVLHEQTHHKISITAEFM